MAECAQDCRHVAFRSGVTRVEVVPPLVSREGRSPPQRGARRHHPNFCIAHTSRFHRLAEISSAT
jgi:hypothetical protein